MRIRYFWDRRWEETDGWVKRGRQPRSTHLAPWGTWETPCVSDIFGTEGGRRLTAGSDAADSLGAPTWRLGEPGKHHVYPIFLGQKVGGD